MDEPIPELALDEGEIEAQGEGFGDVKLVAMRRDRAPRDLDATRHRNAELALEIANHRGSHQGRYRELARDAARDALDSRDVVLGEEIVEPFAVDIERKCGYCNVVGAQQNYPIV